MRIWLLLLHFALLPAGLLAQAAASFHYTSVNIGFSAIPEELREGYLYAPITLLPSTSLWVFGAFSVYAEGQIVYANLPVSPGAAYEAGMNMGLRYQLALSPQWLLNAAIGSGPHYITVRTEQQAPGFIFSDNFELGLTYLPPGKAWGINLRSRFRHISNAGFKRPNIGIDNLFVIGGLRWAL